MENFNPLKKIQELAQKAREEGTVDQTPADIFKRGQEQKKPVTVSLEEAEKIFGKDFLGPESVEAAFGISISKERVVPIPFSKEELENAKALGQQLIFQAEVMKMGDGPFGMEFDTITPKNLKKVFMTASDGKPMWYNQDWYDNEEFFVEKTPPPCWKLTSKDVVPNSTSKNYLEQTEVLVSHIKNDVFKGVDLPKEYAEAIAEFEEEKAAIAERMKGDNWKDASQWLTDLKITKLTRETPVEAMYRLVLQERTNKEKLLSSKYTWTSGRASSSELVIVGDFVSVGADVHSDQPDYSGSNIGVSFSRMK